MSFPSSSFGCLLSHLDVGPLATGLGLIDRATVADVDAALQKTPVTPQGFCALLSESTEQRSDLIEATARNLTAQRFGRVVNLYIPLYLTSSCINDCDYCGFGASQPFARSTLTLDQLKQEAEILLAEGYKNLLLVAGEDRRAVNVDYLESAIRLLKKIGFVFISLEAGPLGTDEYRRLGVAGLDVVTVYQETYHQPTYRAVHVRGPKQDFEYRLNTPERAAAAGIRTIGVGFLLGLYNFRSEALCLSSHIKYLRRKFWQTSIAISFPRIHTSPPGFDVPAMVSDKELIRLILAMRLAHPDAILTLSTREAPALRDRLFGAGINQVSAGSKTAPGAYAEGSDDKGREQFPVVDDRTPGEVLAAIRHQGLEWVFKDWDSNLRPVSFGP